MWDSTPTYSNPCLVQSTATSFFLFGVVANSATEGRLELNSVDSDSNGNLTGRLITSDISSLWSYTAPIVCTKYAGISKTTIHIQQFTSPWTYDVNVSPTANPGEAVVEKPTGGAKPVSLESPKLFAIVGHAGDTMYALGKINITDPYTKTAWNGLVVKGTADVPWKNAVAWPKFPSETAFLVVGTFDTKSTIPVGHITAFEAGGDSGLRYSTSVSDLKDVVVQENPLPFQTTFKLTKDAISVQRDTTAYILDKNDGDNTIVVYEITPGISTNLNRMQASTSVPLFNPSMAASASASNIVVYSVQDGKPCVNIFDIKEKKWLGPGLSRQNLPSAPGLGGGNGGGNGIDSGNSSSGKSNAAIIGGAVAGVLVLVLIAAFFIVRRKRQHRGRGRISQKHSSVAGGAVGGGSGGSSDLGAEEREENKPVLSDYQQQQNRASLNMVDSSRGSILTLNSSSTAPLAYAPHRSSTRPLFSGQSQPEQPTSAPLTVPQQLQLQQQQIQQQQQLQQQQARHGASNQGMEVLSLPAILEQHPFELHGSEADEEQLRKLEQESPYVTRPYSNVPSFSYPTVYQDGPRHSQQPIRTTVINPYSGASVVDDDEQEPYVLPDPIIVAPTPMPHKAELLD